MVKQSLKQKGTSTQTVFIRRTLKSNLLEGIIEIPSALKNRLVELIVLPVDSEKKRKENKKRVDSPLRRFAGAWAGEPLIREVQGQYEVREELL
ncbi:conserved hypothetical protein [delta proteobacterium NaphS2]|nr:conserved hypothetical protein [delta proteobacterium NaphS2]